MEEFPINFENTIIGNDLDIIGAMSKSISEYQTLFYILFGVLLALFISIIVLDFTGKIRLTNTVVSTLIVTLSPVLTGLMFLTWLSTGFFGILLFLLTSAVVIYTMVKVTIIPLDKRQNGFELRSKEHNHMLSAKRMIISAMISSVVLLVLFMIFVALLLIDNEFLISSLFSAVIVVLFFAPFTFGLSLLILPFFVASAACYITGTSLIFICLIGIISVGFLQPYILLASGCIRTALNAMKDKKALKICTIIFGLIPVINLGFGIVSIIFGNRKMKELEKTDIPVIIEVK